MPALIRHAVLCAGLAWALPAVADDASAGVPMPPLRILQPQGGRMRPEAVSVQLDGDQVQVRWSLPKRHAAMQLGLAWPAYGWLGASEPYPVRHAPELKVTVDQRPVSLDEQVDAVLGTQPLTAPLRAAQLDPWLITESPPLVTPGQGPAWEALLAQGAIKREDGQFLAQWSAARRVSFALPARAAEIGLSYAALPAFGALAAGELPPEALSRGVCAHPARYRDLLAGRAWVFKAYTLPVSIGGQAPGQVRLRMAQPPTPDSWLVACTPLGRGSGSVRATQAFTVSVQQNVLKLLVFSPAGAP